MLKHCRIKAFDMLVQHWAVVADCHKVGVSTSCDVECQCKLQQAERNFHAHQGRRKRVSELLVCLVVPWDSCGLDVEVGAVPRWQP
jgi:hypothetical protein